ncbi:hypothetical protein ACKKBG_A12095 [Auxenochlorella protothecoides x Auxenochlorella symbiontica]
MQYSKAMAMAVLAVALLAAPVGAVKAITDWEDAFITHYGGSQDGMDPSSPSFGTSEGACGYGSISKDAYPYFSVAAFSPSNHYYQSDALKACGQCFQIQCEEGRNGKTGVCKTDAQGEPLSILVMISDVCPECEANHIDVQSLAFGKLADQGLGNIDVRYRRVECAVPENMKVSVMNYDGAGQWLRLSIDDTGGYAAVKSVSVKSSSSSSWTTMSNTWGAVWEDGSAPQPPLDFQIECADGQVVSADSVVKQNGGISGGVGGAISFSTSVQFAITDPAASAVSAFDGPADPMVVTSTTPGNSDAATGASSGNATATASGNSSGNTTGTTSASGSSACVDIPAPGSFSCAEQQGWGKCEDSTFVSSNYCALTCGRCGANATASPSTASPSTASPAAGDSSCSDVTPSGGVSCQQRKDWGQCSQSWLTSGSYCQATCGSCGSSASGSSPASSSSPSTSGSSDCQDTPPSGGSTCEQQLQWGACSQGWMTSGNYCAATCGRCGSGASTSPAQVSSYSGPAGRRLLRA